ncbi:hypothetical protein BHE74_00027399, partial [Ensete ventricosum]
MKEKTCLIMRQYRSILMLLELVERYNIAYCLLHSLVEHSCINPKSYAFGYLDEKSIDTGLMKFLGLCPSAL